MSLGKIPVNPKTSYKRGCLYQNHPRAYPSESPRAHFSTVLMSEPDSASSALWHHISGSLSQYSHSIYTQHITDIHRLYRWTRTEEWFASGQGVSNVSDSLVAILCGVWRPRRASAAKLKQGWEQRWSFFWRTSAPSLYIWEGASCKIQTWMASYQEYIVLYRDYW